MLLSKLGAPTDHHKPIAHVPAEPILSVPRRFRVPLSFPRPRAGVSSRFRIAKTLHDPRIGSPWLQELGSPTCPSQAHHRPSLVSSAFSGNQRTRHRPSLNSDGSNGRESFLHIPDNKVWISSIWGRQVMARDCCRFSIEALWSKCGVVARTGFVPSTHLGGCMSSRWRTGGMKPLRDAIPPRLPGRSRSVQIVDSRWEEPKFVLKKASTMECGFVPPNAPIQRWRKSHIHGNRLSGLRRQDKHGPGTPPPETGCRASGDRTNMGLEPPAMTRLTSKARTGCQATRDDHCDRNIWACGLTLSPTP
jgi:hypothetical protein